MALSQIVFQESLPLGIRTRLTSVYQNDSQEVVLIDTESRETRDRRRRWDQYSEVCLPPPPPPYPQFIILRVSKAVSWNYSQLNLLLLIMQHDDS